MVVVTASGQRKHKRKAHGGYAIDDRESVKGAKVQRGKIWFVLQLDTKYKNGIFLFSEKFKIIKII